MIKQNPTAAYPKISKLILLNFWINEKLITTAANPTIPMNYVARLAEICWLGSILEFKIVTILFEYIMNTLTPVY